MTWIKSGRAHVYLMERYTCPHSRYREITRVTFVSASVETSFVYSRAVLLQSLVAVRKSSEASVALDMNVLLKWRHTTSPSPHQQPNPRYHHFSLDLVTQIPQKTLHSK